VDTVPVFMQSTSVDKRMSQSQRGYLLCIAVTANMLTANMPTCLHPRAVVQIISQGCSHTRYLLYLTWW
jgi:hypothetical protein